MGAGSRKKVLKMLFPPVEKLQSRFVRQRRLGTVQVVSESTFRRGWRYIF